ncbi:MAG: Extradiol ring-cleavage dioxygenase class protein subunit [Phenylobacterium sp.]|nr:Extradiol ring-cleavage dioxygenase class protein subunit [Phenylobacterium sp.]
MSATSMPVVFFGHGSPAVALEDSETTRAWAAMARSIGKPRAILSISAHWVTDGLRVTAMARPRTIHDFGRSLPAALFDIQYPVPGDPALARRIQGLLAPVPVALDEQWGLDHGTWSVLCKAYPEADVPVVQLSMDANLTPAGHFAIGERLRPLRDEGVLIVATGNIVHNLPAMNWGDRRCAPYDWAAAFNDHIRRAIVDDRPGDVVEYAALGQAAQAAVPTPEHFWPLLYALGARRPEDAARLGPDHIEHGSLSMTSVLLDSRHAAADTAA